MALKEKASKTYLYITGVVATAALSIGGYYIYKYIKYSYGNDGIDASMSNSIRQLKTELYEVMNEPQNDKKGELAFRISHEINKLSLRYYNEKYPNQDEKRRKEIDNPELYKDYCDETLVLKEECVHLASKKVLELLDNSIDSEKIENWITMIEPSKLEEYTLKYVNGTQNGIIPSIDLLKEAYTYYADLLKEEHELLKKSIENDKNEEPQTDELLFYSMMINLKVNDKIFIKYHLTEESMRTGLKERNLLNDPYILNIQDNLKQLMP